MTERLAVLLVRGGASSAAPPGIDPTAMARAMAEDVLDVLGDLDGVQEALAYTPAGAALADAIAWPGTLRIPLPTDPDWADLLLLVPGYRLVVVVTADAPDLPALHVAKVFSALTSASRAACPAISGGWVAAGVAATAGAAPTPASLDPDLDLAAGIRRTPPWHRLIRPVDVTTLDPGLEGWEATRRLLGGRPG